MDELTDWIAVGISAISLIVAILALICNACTSRKANRIQQQLVDIEYKRDQDRADARSKAQLRAELRNTAKHTYRLYVVNEGEAEAREVQITLDGNYHVEIGTIIGAKSEASCILPIHMKWGPPFAMEISWVDLGGEQRSYKTTLTY